MQDTCGSRVMGPGPSHALRFQGPINSVHEAPALGNGDLGALVQVFQNEFRLHLAKTDIWDARYDHVAKDSVVTQDDLIRLSRDYGFRLEGPNYGGRPVYDRTPPKGLRYFDHGPGWERHVFPCPKAAGLIRICHSGTSSTRIRTVVDIRTGVVTAEFEMEFGWHGVGILRIEAFVDRNANAVRMRISQERLQGALRLCVEKPPDSVDRTIPPPRVRRFDDWHGAVSQAIPAGYGVKAFHWHLAASFPVPARGRSVRPLDAHPYRLWQVCELPPGGSMEFSVGVATDRDPVHSATGGRGDALVRARALAGEAAPRMFDRARRRHEKGWASFWDRSGIELQDKELETTWYRNLFAFGCLLSPRRMTPFGSGNIVTGDAQGGHGGYTVNMNIQKMILASLPTNHPEWLDGYGLWLDHMRPSLRHLAKITFGLQGLHSPHWLFPYLPPHRQTTSNQCGRALGMTGWHGQPLWWRWECFRDRRFLRQRAYPYFKEAACFYWRYLKKYLDESGDLYPSLNLESPFWTKGFAHNRDCFIDLILFRHTFQWAMRSSEILGTDAAWRKRWTWALSKIRPVQVDALPNGAFWIRADRNDGPGNLQDNWRSTTNLASSQSVTAAWTVFPGEYVEGDEKEGVAPALRSILRRHHWARWHPDMIWIHHWWCAIPALRLGLPDAFAMARKIILRERFPAGQARTTQWIYLLPDSGRAPEDNYLGVAATTEMLLQSQGGVIRLFPVWPRKKRAAFQTLPARGGFLVSAEWDPARGLTAQIRSLAGEPCRVRWREATLPRVTCAGRRIAASRAGDSVSFPTQRRRSYELTWRA